MSPGPRPRPGPGTPHHSGAPHHAALRHWALYRDWCEATGREPLPADAGTLEAFLRQCPASRALTVARLGAIRLMHDRAGIAFAPLGEDTAPLPWRTGEGWLGLPEALACIPTTGWTRGLTGRRDGFILVAAGELGLSRTRIRHLGAGDIEAGPGHTIVAGTTVRRGQDAAGCPACAVTRWLDVLGRLEKDWRGGTRQYLALARPSPVHACEVPPTPGWQQAFTLIPGIDRHGWTSEGLALSTRSLSAVLARRQDPVQASRARDVRPTPAPDEREEPCGYTRERFEDISQMLDALDEKIADALKESERVLA
ncbi:hypothetical protein, partial [Arthrobacter cavernae]